MVLSPSPVLEIKRSRQEIDEILSAAKLERKDLLPVAQEIVFSQNFSGTEYRLVELPKEVGVELVKVGSRWVFRGEPNEHVVLCTKDTTYEIKEAETSNSLVIFRELAFPEEAKKTSSGSSSSSSSDTSLPIISSSVCEAETEDVVMEEEETIVRKIECIVHSYFELKKITPNLSRIRNVLAESAYKGINEEENFDFEKCFTPSKLLEVIPASSGEIESYLKTVRVFDCDGFLRLVDDDYLFRVFTLVTQLVDENSWKIDRIPKSVVITTLITLEPPFVINKIFEWFFIRKQEDNDDIYCMNEDEICKFMGESILKPVGRFNLREFMKVWQDSVPEGLKVNLKQLEGSAVTNTQTLVPTIWFFPEYNLPESTIDRFAVLFEAKQKWTMEEITPFLRNLPSYQSIGVLLNKYTRVNTVNGVKYYSSKHSK